MENQIRTFWQNNSCGSRLVGDLSGETLEAYRDFFNRYDKYRYDTEPHILSGLDCINFSGKKILEIGLGQGTDAEQIIKRGGVYSGIDLTEESIKRTKTRFLLKNLPFEKLEQSSAGNIPFSDDSFDIIYSFGVLHHIPDIKKAQKEILRVLKPDGELVIMLYAKWSLNYLFSILILKRLGLLLLYVFNINIARNYGEHLKLAKKVGIWNYLSIKNFIHVTTDGHLNPYSKVYDIFSVRNDFTDFEVKNIYKKFMYAPPLKIKWLPLENLLGWHLWIQLKPKGK